MLIKVYITALKRFRIFSKIFDSQRVGIPIINERNWCSCAMLPWKKVVLGLAVMGKYHSKLLMLFNLAFLMKCKYKSIPFLDVIIAIRFNLEHCKLKIIWCSVCACVCVCGKLKKMYYLFLCIGIIAITTT